jgi:hypothetical protein
MSGEGNVESYRYEWELREAQRFLTNDVLVSVKIRPIEAVGSLSNRYVYHQEYAEIIEFISQYKKKWDGSVNRGNAIIVDVGGSDVIFVEHETGPEIVFYLHLAREAAIATGATAIAAQQVVKLINMVCEIIRKHAHAKNSGENSERYYGAGALSVEMRLKETGKILKQVVITSKAAGKVVDSLSEIIAE